MAEISVLVIGKNGNVAGELARAPWRQDWRVTCRSIDLSAPDSNAIGTLIDADKARLVVNAAGYTFVDQAEDERDLAFAINAEGPAAIAEACSTRGVPLIHLSTDYVFDGMKPGPYVEDDPINPLSVYGESKAAGETAVRRRLAAHVILRTSWVFSPFGRNFVKTMLRLGGERDTIDVVADQRGCPTAAVDIARVIATVAERIADPAPAWGTYNYVGAGPVTWYDFARAIFAEAAPLGFAVPQRVAPVATVDFAAKAPRPKNSVLDCSKIRAAYGIDQAPWRAGLTACLAELRSTGRA